MEKKKDSKKTKKNKKTIDMTHKKVLLPLPVVGMYRQNLHDNYLIYCPIIKNYSKFLFFIILNISFHM